jgi:PAS domain S-box-containing protein
VGPAPVAKNFFTRQSRNYIKQYGKIPFDRTSKKTAVLTAEQVTTMWAPDIRTLFFVLFLIDMFLTMVLYVFWKNQKTYSGFKTWMLSLLAVSSGYGLLLLQGIIPGLFSIVIANLLIMLAIVMRIDSIRRFVWSEALPVIAYGTLLPAAILYLIFTYVIDSIELRALVLSVMIISFLIVGSILSIIGKDKENRTLMLAFFSVFLTLAMVTLVRGIFWLAVPGPHSLLDTDAVNLIFMFVSILMDILMTGLFIMLNMTRFQTELHESEQKFRAIFDQTFQFTGLLSPDGTVIEVNRSALKFCGITGADVTGKPFWDTPWWTHSPKLQEQLRTAMIHAAGGEFIRFEATHPAADGSIHYIDFSLKPVTDDSGRVTLIIPEGRDITERKMAENALGRATTKLNVLNHITFTDIQNAVFSLNGYFELGKRIQKDERLQQCLDKQQGIIQTITGSLKFARQYRDLGQKPPVWQNVQQAFLMGISHLDISGLSRRLDIGNLEIYADPLLENVFFSLAENVILHGTSATDISVGYRIVPDGLVLIFEDNGKGISRENKEKIFDRRFDDKMGMGLFMVREILSITEITITETGDRGCGARFEIHVPKNAYRFRNKEKKD